MASPGVQLYDCVSRRYRDGVSRRCVVRWRLQVRLRWRLQVLSRTMASPGPSPALSAALPDMTDLTQTGSCPLNTNPKLPSSPRDKDTSLHCHRPLHTRRNCQFTMPGARRRGRPHTPTMDDIKTWTELPVEESIRMTEDRDKWRKYIHGVCSQPSDRGRLKNRIEKKEYCKRAGI